MAKTNGYVLSAKDHARIEKMLRWYERGGQAALSTGRPRTAAGAAGGQLRFGTIDSVSAATFVGTFFVSGTTPADAEQPSLYQQTIQRAKDVLIEAGNTFCAARYNNQWWCVAVYGAPIFDPLRCGDDVDDESDEFASDSMEDGL